MRFAFTEDQLMFRDAVRDVLARECPPTVVRKAWEESTGRAASVYRTLAETGLVSATASEAAGGMGMTELDVVLALDECGYAALPDPVVETALVAIPLIEAVGTDALKSAWLEKLTSGEAIAAIDFDGGSFVPHAPVADLLLFVRDGALHAVPRSDVKLAAQVSVDRARRIAAVDFTPSAKTLVADAETAKDALEAARLRAVLGTAAVLNGLTRRMLDMTVEYAKVRHQFGKPIGSFQAVKHKLADCLIKLEFSRPMVSRAAYSMATNDPERAVHVAMAKAYASDAAQVVAKHALQVHGAIGYTIECDLHMWMKRAWALSQAYGDAFHQRKIVADAVLGPA